MSACERCETKTEFSQTKELYYTSSPLRHSSNLHLPITSLGRACESCRSLFWDQIQCSNVYQQANALDDKERVLNKFIKSPERLLSELALLQIQRRRLQRVAVAYGRRFMANEEIQEPLMLASVESEEETDPSVIRFRLLDLD